MVNYYDYFLPTLLRAKETYEKLIKLFETAPNNNDKLREALSDVIRQRDSLLRRINNPQYLEPKYFDNYFLSIVNFVDSHRHNNYESSLTKEEENYKSLLLVDLMSVVEDLIRLLNDLES